MPNAPPPPPPQDNPNQGFNPSDQGNNPLNPNTGSLFGPDCKWSSKQFQALNQRLTGIESSLKTLLLNQSVQGEIMSKLSDQIVLLLANDATMEQEVESIAASSASVASNIAAQAATIQAQQNTIADLQNQIAQGEPVTDDDMQKLADLNTALTDQNSSLVTSAQALQQSAPVQAHRQIKAKQTLETRPHLG